MQSEPARGLLEILQQVPDPRGRKGQRHSLSAMLAAVVCAILCGCHSLRLQQHWLKLVAAPVWHLLGFTRKPPTRQAFANLLARVDPLALEQAVLEFVEQLALECPQEGSAKSPSSSASFPLPEAEVWDGKTLRGTREGDSRAQQILVRMNLALKRVIGSEIIPAETNEAKTAYELVKKLVVKDKLIIADAAYCQREICQEITDQGGEYLVLVKDNQPQLHRDIEQAFVIPRGFSPLPTAQI